MAGLSHNPKASYCTKWLPGEPTDPDAVCDYCQARGLGPQPIVEDDKPVTAKDVEPGKPLIALFFDKLGIVKGQRIDDVRTTDGYRFAGTFDIVEVSGLSDPETHTLEAVITLQESGTRTLHRVVWSKVVSFSTT